MRSKNVIKFDGWRAKIGGLASLLFAVSLTVFTASAVHAMSFELGEGVVLDLDTTIRYSASLRLAEQSRRLLGNPNIDDGNLKLSWIRAIRIANNRCWIHRCGIVSRSTGGTMAMINSG